MKKKIKEYSFEKDYTSFGSMDAKLGAGYGTMKQTMVPRKMADGFPYDINNNDIEDEIDLIDIDQSDKFNSMVGSYRPPIEKDNLNFRYDRKAFVDGETRGISDSVLRDYISCIIEMAITLNPRSSRSDYVINQFGDKINHGTTAGWSHAYPFDDDDDDDELLNYSDFVKNYFEKEGI